MTWGRIFAVCDAFSVQHCHVYDGRNANILRIVNQHQTSCDVGLQSRKSCAPLLQQSLLRHSLCVQLHQSFLGPIDETLAICDHPPTHPLWGHTHSGFGLHSTSGGVGVVVVVVGSDSLDPPAPDRPNFRFFFALSSSNFVLFQSLWVSSR